MPMILLLDNYDSFVHNLARYFRRAGCVTRVIRSDEIDVRTCRALAPDAIVISPGPKRPEDAGCSVPVIAELSHKIPMLGVCLGHQAIATALGGRIRRSGPVHGSADPIVHDGSGIFTGCPNPMSVARYHSLAIEIASLPAGLSVTAVNRDGIAMAVHHQSRPLWGVQFHPESVLTNGGEKIVQNFISLTDRYHSMVRSQRMADQQQEMIS